jgi:hypothetical protein
LRMAMAFPGADAHVFPWLALTSHERRSVRVQPPEGDDLVAGNLCDSATKDLKVWYIQYWTMRRVCTMNRVGMMTDDTLSSRRLGFDL